MSTGFFKKSRNTSRKSIPVAGYLIPRPMMTKEQWDNSYTLPSIEAVNVGAGSTKDWYEPLSISGRNQGTITTVTTTNSAGEQVSQNMLVIGSVAR